MLIGCPAREWAIKPIETWIRNVQAYTYRNKEIAIASEDPDWLLRLKEAHPDITLIHFAIEDWVYHHDKGIPYNRIYAIARGREVLRLHAAQENFDYLLYQDTDNIIQDPDAIQKILRVMAEENLDALIDNKIGFYGMFNRPTFLSIHFYGAMNMKTRRHYLEDFTVFDQLKTYNLLGPYFKIKWDHVVKGTEQLFIDGKVQVRRGDT